MFEAGVKVTIALSGHRRMMANTMPGTLSQEDFEQLFPRTVAWVAEQERRIFRDGVPLLPEHVAIALSIGVIHVERVRLLRVARIDPPNDPELERAASEMALITDSTWGLTVGHGIFIRSDRWNSRSTIAHELHHVMQFETLGGIGQFLRAYIGECNTYGYHNAPMELAARVREVEFPDL